MHLPGALRGQPLLNLRKKGIKKGGLPWQAPWIFQLVGDTGFEPVTSTV